MAGGSTGPGRPIRRGRAPRPPGPALWRWRCWPFCWALPLGLGLVFAALLVDANPMLSRLVTWPEGLDLPAAERVLFWLGLACLIWPA